ncbi:uncharacterized protein LOC128198986 [Bicyclus anynana]|uniref:Uncharacterized protein LOC128198986 n=1 Tax=Bicyclus anynana TaxID=110368 RepID=A0ABM3LVI4_BICAN|nr:uncharacterized protein LOC128198986 [Bicyclus anynana]
MGTIRVNIVIIALMVLCVNCNTELSEANDANQRDISHVTRESIGVQDNIIKYYLDNGQEKPFVQENVDTKVKTNPNANRRTLFWPRKKPMNKIKQLDQYKSIELLNAIKERLDKSKSLKRARIKPTKPYKLPKPPIKPRKPKYDITCEIDNEDNNINSPEDNNEERLLGRFPPRRPGLNLYDNMEILSVINERLNKKKPKEEPKKQSRNIRLSNELYPPPKWPWPMRRYHQ